MTLGKIVKKLREEKGWTQAKLAEEARLGENGQQAIAALENRESTTSKFAPALADALGVSVGVLLGQPEPTSSNEDRIKRLSRPAQKLIEEIIAAEESGSSSPKIIEALTKVLHVAIPIPDDGKHHRISRAIDDE